MSDEKELKIKKEVQTEKAAPSKPKIEVENTQTVRLYMRELDGSRAILSVEGERLRVELYQDDDDDEAKIIEGPAMNVASWFNEISVQVDELARLTVENDTAAKPQKDA